MTSIRSRNPVALALLANAILLAGILVTLLSRGHGSGFVPAAFGADQAPIAGGAGVFIMPGQLGDRQFGCYLLDVDSQNLVVYQYEPGTRHLALVAARSYKWDRKLHDLSTSPPTEEIHRLFEKEQQGFRKAQDNAVQPNPDPAPINKENP
jgi:hypothetical protein